MVKSQNATHVETPRVLSTRKVSEQRSKKVSGARVNSIGYLFDEEGIQVHARRDRSLTKQAMYVHFMGGLSKNDAVKMMEIVIDRIKKQGLPAEPEIFFIDTPIDIPMST
jgi:hypothetical protein